jgi:hypothetical protein
MRWMVLVLLFALAAPARAETPAVQQSARFDYHKLGVGLLIAGGALIVVGGVFVGLAANANAGILDNHQYHADLASQRDGFEATDTALFAVGAGAMVTGLVFVFDGPRR